MSRPTILSSSRVKIGVAGVTGRIGARIKTLLDQSLYPDLAFAVGLARSRGGENTTGLPADLVAQSDAVIDFSAPALLPDLLAACRGAGTPVLVATTGLEDHHRELIREAAQSIPVLYAANTSLGICVLQMALEQTARLLGPGFDIEIIETHHRRKIDSPSGTALALADSIDRGRGNGDSNAVSQRIFSRHGTADGLRPQGPIGFAVVRGGSVAGDHTVAFLGDGERLEFTHRAENPDLFAHGALVAIRWLIRQPPGLYRMQDVLDERPVLEP